MQQLIVKQHYGFLCVIGVSCDLGYIKLQMYNN